jgi:hypothetical protein
MGETSCMGVMGNIDAVGSALRAAQPVGMVFR